MEIETSSVLHRFLLTCAGSISATLLGLAAMVELLASSQLLDTTAESNEKTKSTSRKCQTTKLIDGEGNETENNTSENDLGEDQDVLENGGEEEEEGKNAPTKDGVNGEDVGNDDDNGGESENSGNGDGGDDEENDDGGSDENDEDNNDDGEEEDVDEEGAEEDTFELGEDDEENLPPPKKRKK